MKLNCCYLLNLNVSFFYMQFFMLKFYFNRDISTNARVISKSICDFLFVKMYTYIHISCLYKIYILRYYIVCEGVIF